MAVSDLVVAWEESSIIRSRFRRCMKWLQWPVQSTDALEGSDHDDEKLEKHPVSTKALELNADALLAMLDAFNGNFIDIYALQTEAPICFCKRLRDYTEVMSLTCPTMIIYH